MAASTSDQHKAGKMSFCLVLVLLAIFTITTLPGCKKLLDALAPYPSETQVGKGTFAMMLNGGRWIPNGWFGRPKVDMSYDRTFRGGVFSITAARISDNDNNKTVIIIGADSTLQPGRIEFGRKNLTAIYVDFSNDACMVDSRDSLVAASGYCEITKLDTARRIFSGRFAFTFVKPGCTTKEMKEGRFDLTY